MKNEYSTKEICELCNVSRKQLVYYENHGLLNNVLRKENNYRYYTENNVLELLIVKESRRIGFSVEEIRSMIMNRNVNSTRDIIRKRVDNAKEDLDQSVLRYEQCNERYVQFLNAITLLNTKDAVNDSVGKDYEILNFPGLYMLSRRFKSTFMDVGEHIDIVAEMYRIIEEYDITTLGSLINIYYNHFDSSTCSFDNAVHDIEVCMTITDMKKPCPYFKTRILKVIAAGSVILEGSFC